MYMLYGLTILQENETFTLKEVPIMAVHLVSTIDLGNQKGGSVDPQIAVSGNNVYVVWEHTPENNGAIYFARSTDNGASFETSRNLG